jgi:hypothetical protein
MLMHEKIILGEIARIGESLKSNLKNKNKRFVYQDCLNYFRYVGITFGISPLNMQIPNVLKIVYKQTTYYYKVAMAIKDSLTIEQFIQLQLAMYKFANSLPKKQESEINTVLKNMASVGAKAYLYHFDIYTKKFVFEENKNFIEAYYRFQLNHGGLIGFDWSIYEGCKYFDSNLSPKVGKGKCIVLGVNAGIFVGNLNKLNKMLEEKFGL